MAVFSVSSRWPSVVNLSHQFTTGTWLSGSCCTLIKSAPILSFSSFHCTVGSRRLFLNTTSLMLGGFGSSSSASARSRTSAVEEVLKNVEWPEQFPFKQEDFQRYDETPDTNFYSYPRFVTHIDDPAINALTKFYASIFPPSNTKGVALLDMCSSWISHYPKAYKQERIVGLGINEEELKRNLVLTEYAVQDLNANPQFTFDDNSFDVITNSVSVDYLTKPLDIFKEMRRVLKPGGLAVMSFSNRCFFTKAISIWTATGDIDHVWIVGSYFHYAGGFEPAQAYQQLKWGYDEFTVVDGPNEYGASVTRFQNCLFAPHLLFNTYGGKIEMKNVTSSKAMSKVTYTSDFGTL